MEKETYTFVIALAGAISGVIGTVMGITNFMRALIKDRVKIKVYPQVNVFLENKDEKVEPVARVCIEVVNLSDFPVTINDVGFFLNKYFKNGKVSFLDKQLMHGGKLPKRMEPRSAITVYHPNPGMFMDDVEKICGAYATTQCGREFKGNSKAFKKRIFQKAPT